MQGFRMNFDFLKEPEVQLLFSLFNENAKDLFVVGGAVRNEIAGFPITDIDLSTPAKPDEITDILSSAQIEFSDKGKKFGTICANINGKTFEITSFRKDMYGKSRFPKVEFIKNRRIDAWRRDFTMNAIYVNQNMEIFDQFNGINDIKNGVVRFIGNASKSIANDPLRILRYFRFCSQYFYENFDEDTFNLCIAEFSKTFVLSRKKFATELEKIQCGKGKNIILDKWEKSGILKAIQNFMKEENVK